MRLRCVPSITEFLRHIVVVLEKDALTSVTRVLEFENKKRATKKFSELINESTLIVLSAVRLELCGSFVFAVFYW